MIEGTKFPIAVLARTQKDINAWLRRAPASWAKRAVFVKSVAKLTSVSDEPFHLVMIDGWDLHTTWRRPNAKLVVEVLSAKSVSVHCLSVEVETAI